MNRWLSIVILFVASSICAADDAAAFEKDVLPLLKQHCYKCHGGEAKIKGGLRLTTKDFLLKGGDTGPAFDKDKPGESLILKAINYKDGLEMPPTGKLPAKDIETLTKWINAGAPMTGGPVVATAHGKPKSDGKDYWAYQPLKPVAPPVVKNSAWVINPIDAFIVAKLEVKGLTPNPPADPVASIRRVTYDLTGLPPTPENVDAYVRASSEGRKAKIESLLASPHYGERWGRHWLDLVRYAETNGYERDNPKPFAYRYRDYVIRSFNADKPYDRFIKEQLAGDEIPEGGADAIIATGYYRLGIWDDEPADPELSLFDGYDDLVTTTGQVFLGMTVNCCRCHDHKIDPLPQTDYYRLLACFRDVPPYSDTRDVKSKFNLTDISPPEIRQKYEVELRERQAKMDALKLQLKPLEDAAIAKMTPEDQLKVQDGKREEVLRKAPRFLEGENKQQYNRLKNELDTWVKKPRPHQELALSVHQCAVRPPVTKVLIRGNPHSPGVEVQPGFPKVLGAPDPVIAPRDPGAKSSGRRTALAEWIASPKNQLTARVMVNRIWGYHFGKGIVTSTNDFGQFGEKPTHPELLDWLANEFIRSGWSVKHMHRLIMNSNTYRMSAHGNDAAHHVDPADQLLWRFPMRRLGAEEVRDSILATTGQLNLQMFGPSVYPPIPKEVLAGQSVPGQGWHTSPPDQAHRRSVYVHIKRSLQVPILATHDQADTDLSCPVRYTTTVPTQALGMLNGVFMQESATALARRLQKECGDDVTKQVTRAIRLTTGRVPNDSEVAKDAAFIAQLTKDHQLTAEMALRHYCLLALNANEFVYLD